eukprot:TRINITY_DN16197_c0_g4_i1.p2 TRINITY_DN16197_c0_g4~~TRINITY_DN16197_c0_g4_i1.p2  ORF type:complete len:173 (+),score=26.44 TRINITY_DN16197_c0_g4_i1:37-555(+)
MHSANQCTNCKRWCNGCQCAGCGSIAVWSVGMDVRLRLQAGQGAPFSMWCLSMGEQVMVLRPAEGGFVLVQSMRNNAAKGWIALTTPLALTSWLVPTSSLHLANNAAPVNAPSVSPTIMAAKSARPAPIVVPPSPSSSSFSATSTTPPTPDSDDELPIESVKEVLTTLKLMF